MFTVGQKNGKLDYTHKASLENGFLPVADCGSRFIALAVYMASKSTA
jgi:hypothetical protein